MNFDRSINPWFEENLICPVHHSSLQYLNGKLICSDKCEYPVIEGVPVMLLERVPHTLNVASASLARAKGDRNIIDYRAPNLYLETLPIGEQEKEGIVRLMNEKDLKVDPVVSFLIVASSGNSYRHLLGNLNSYPIPELRLPDGKGELFLDLGCSWGRWCISAARKGYTVVGIDPSLGAIMAARRVAKKMGLSIKYLVGDARYLPFKNSSFDIIFSYSVLQHLSKNHVREVCKSIKRVLKPKGFSLIQMPNFFGLRNLQNQIKRGFRKPQGFEVRYWKLSDLKNTFEKLIGDTEIEVDCYFGLGLQKADVNYMPLRIKLVIHLSEILRRMSKRFKVLVYIADSVYVKSFKKIHK